MSTGNLQLIRTAQAITLLRTGRQTIPSLAESTGAHRETMAKLIRAMQDQGHVRPNGSEMHGKTPTLLWQWVEA